jgi:gas vesicle protein
MSNDPDQIRAEIERTRANLSENVNSLTDTVTPSHIAKRQVGKARTAVFGIRDNVIGTASQVGSAATDAASGLGDTASAVGNTVTEAPAVVRTQTAGNPLAAGLIAVGVGWLVGSLLPATAAEKQAAVQVKQTATPAIADAAQQVTDHLKEPAAQAVASVQDAASEAAATVRDESVSSAHDVRDQAQDAKDTIQDTRG